MFTKFGTKISRFGLLIWILSSLAGSGARAQPADLALEPVVGGFDRPVIVRHSGDGTGRLFIVEQAGQIWIYDVPSATLLATPFLDIRTLVDDASNEQGLLGLAFHPDFTENGLFFVNYTRDPGLGLDRTVIARYELSGDPNEADPGTAVVLMEVEQDFTNHNGGNILFGPDGYLYAGLGDGGAGEDPNNRAQDLGSLLGKMLRIDVDGTPPASPNDLCGLNPTAYGIPPDNPFAGGSGDCDEIWAYGLRNPWRWSFDRSTGDLFIGDVGQYAVEEVDLQPSSGTGGENYGWSCMEGNNLVNYNPCDGSTLTAPIFTYDHGLGCSITGGYMYRGPIASFRGNYITGDYCTGRIWFGTNTGSWAFSQWMDTVFSISSFGEDEIGNVYMTDFNTNAVYRFALPAATGAGEVPDGAGLTTPLRIGKTATTALALTWDASCRGADTDYGVYEGALGNFESHESRLCSTGGATTAEVPPDPGNRFFLVVPRNSVREGSYGQNNFGLERPAGATTCLDQALAGCD